MTFEEYLKKYRVPLPLDKYYNYQGAYNAGYQPRPWTSLPLGDQMQDLYQMLMGIRKPMNPLTAYMWSDKYKMPGYTRPGYVAPQQEGGGQ